MSSLVRSSSNHHISPSLGHLSHYGSAVDPATANSATPHLSHLRQSSSIGFGGMHAEEHHYHSHYPTSAAGYDVYEEIGVGAFATVYRAAVKETGEPVAIKVIDLDQFNTNWEEIRREILIMSLVHHPNVVRILTSFVEEQDLWILMPLLEGGSCAHIMKTIYPTGMKDEAMIATILKEVLHGLLYFHKDGRLHRDLKAGNVLISAQGDVQLADFGVAGTLMENGDRKKARRTFTGTPCWMAPEVMEHNENGYDEKADVWSFAITALELAYGRAPYAKFPPMKVMVLTLQEEPPTAEVYKDHSYEFSRHFHSMIEKCLRKDPTKRPSVKKLLEHKFFKSAKDKQYLIDKIIKKMPVKRQPLNPKLLNLCELRHSTVRGAGEDGEEDKGKPVSVGSWVFDKAEFDQMKRQALEEKESEGSHGQRIKSVNASYEEETPKGAQALGIGGKFGHSLAVPSGQPGHPHHRNSSGGSGPMSSADESGSGSDGDNADGEHVTSDEDGHRPLPDFSDPNGEFTPNADDEPVPETRSRAPALLIVSPPNKVPSGTTSPGEHQEGRFRVCDDEQDQDGNGTQNEEHYIHEGNVVYPQGEVYPNHQNYYPSGEDQPPAGDQANGGDTRKSGSFALHNDAFEEDGGSTNQPASSPLQDDHHETHVGRFAVVDDQEEEQ